MSTASLSALVITHNEEANIERCLRALSFCDEIVLVDAESGDRTVEIARRFTDRIWVEPWRGYSGQKTFALEQCTSDWILWVDADEVVTAELAGSIRKALERDSDRVAYEVARRVFYLGAWIRHGGWGEDRVVRLFRAGRARFSEARVHERLEVDGPIGRLSGALEHYSYRDLSHHWEKIQRLAALGAAEARERGGRAGMVSLVFRPLARALRIYVLQKGFLDGWRGLVIAGMGAAYVFLKYALMKENEER